MFRSWAKYYGGHIRAEASRAKFGLDAGLDLVPRTAGIGVLLVFGESGIEARLVDVRQLAAILPSLPGQFIELGLHFSTVFRAKVRQLGDDFGFAHVVTV